MKRILRKTTPCRRVVENIFPTDPHPHSRASYVSLAWYLYLVSEECKLKDRVYWLKFRFELLMKWQHARKELRCEYCGFGPLIIQARNEHPNVATLDHIIARSQKGAEYEEGNLRVACHNCNDQKGSLSEDEFLKMKNLTKEWMRGDKLGVKKSELNNKRKTPKRSKKRIKSGKKRKYLSKRSF